MIDEVTVQAYRRLFVGNGRSYGQYRKGDNNSSKMATVRAQYNDEHVRSHLEGEVGLGLVPILDDDTCWFAVIDIDIHGPNKVEIDVLTVDQRITKLNLPLIPCRSKSGGVHCYAFFTRAFSAATVRAIMAAWAADIGFPNAEIFPKQHSLGNTAHPDDRPLGNWINLPYFDAERTERFAVDGGKQVSLEYFLELAESKRANINDVRRTHDADYDRGPPCLQGMMLNRVEEGGRNIAVFQAGIFLKRAHPEEWRPKLAEFNQKALGTPLEARELRTVAGSVFRRDYQYKCREEPCKTFCNRELCKTREYGITAADDVANEIPMFESVEKIVATPVRWALTIKGKTLEITTAQLFNYEAVRQAVGEMLHIVLPRLKAIEWDTYLREIMSKTTERHEATVEDVMFEKLCEYLRRITKDRTRDEGERRDDLRRGKPTLLGVGLYNAAGQQNGKDPERKWYYAFKLNDFIDFLKRRRALTMPEHQVYSILYKALGEDAKREKVRLGDVWIRNVWCVPEENVDMEEVPTKAYKQEF